MQRRSSAGSYVSTLPNGAKKKVYSNGSTYIGSLNEKGRRHGTGVMMFKDGKYEGGWKNGKQHGRGKYAWNSGSTYEGYWKVGKFDGFGTYTWPSGASYAGEWKKGKKNGHGRFLWSNGTKYEGDFMDDKKHGVGDYVSGTDGTKYYGEYENDQMHGKGTYLFPDGAKYVGQFQNNNFNGKGVYTTPDGTCYIGEFKNDQRHGVGLLKPPHLGTFKVRYSAGKIVEHQDLHTWLKEVECEMYAETFLKEDVTFDVLTKMTDQDLQQLGIKELGKRKKLLAAIAELPSVEAIEPPMSPKTPEMKTAELSIEYSLEGDSYGDLGGDAEISGMEFHKESTDTLRGGDSEEALRRMKDLTLNAISKYREIDQSEINMDKRPIGRGVFGIVYKGEWRGAAVAVKKLMGTLGEKELSELFTEASMLEKLCHHPHVVNYIGIVKSPDVCLVTQFYPKGSIWDIVVKNREEVPWKVIVCMARDAAAGVLHLHKEHVIHRDIAARNCLVDSNYRVVVTDFGLSRVKTSAYQQSNNNFGPVSWMAPEAILERKFSEKSDAYSFGVLLWELVAKETTVFPDIESPYNIALQVIEGKRPAIPSNTPEDFKNLMLECWKNDPEERPDFADIEKKLAAYYWSIPENEPQPGSNK